MPDVEVKLDIKAEYRQALEAIATMGKALEAVQQKANVVVNKTSSATANGKAGNEGMTMQELAALKQASQELSELLAKAAVAGARAGAALQRIADIEVMNQQDIDLLEKAAAGYEKLASMAQQAAEAAEKFNRAGNAGLTTEEMVRMTQAAEKQLETLRAQSEALERSIAAQREQLNVLRATTAEQQKQAQVRSAEDKERERSIALREREAKAEEEDNYRMQLSGKTRLQLVEIIKQLNAQMKEAAAAKDEEAYNKYNRQLTLANQALRKLNMSSRVANIALMQQAQAAQRIGQNLKTLTEGFSGFGEALKNGELNLTSMGSAFVSLMRDFKAGLGPIGWVMLALQGLQEAWNYRAKKEKESIEASKAYIEWEKKLAESIKANKEEIEKYNNELSNQKSLDALIKNHQELNAELEKEIRNIDKATKLELHRLRLSQDADAHALAMKKDELGRQLMLGNITQAEYDETLAAWQKDYDLVKLNNEKLAVDARLSEASEKERLTRQAYTTRTEDFYYWNKQRDKFAWDKNRLAIYNRQWTNADKFLQEKTEELNKLRQAGAGEDAIREAKNAMKDALAEKIAIEKEAKRVLLDKYGRGHGMTVEEGMKIYAQELHEMTKHLAEATRLKEEAERDLNTAISAKEKAEADAETAALNQRVESEQIVDRYESGKKTRQVRIKVEADKQKRANEIESLEKELDSYTKKELKAELEEAKKEAADKNKYIAEHGKRKVSILTRELNERSDSLTKAKGKYFGDGVFKEKEADEVIRLLQAAVIENNQEKIQLYRKILKMSTTVKISTKTLKKINSELGR